MEEESQTSAGIVPVITKVEAAGETLTNGDLDQKIKDEKKEEEENALDGEFIKVEKESLDAQEKLKVLEFEFERVAKELQHSESEKFQLKQDLAVAREKLEERERHCEALYLNQKKLQEQIGETEEKFNSHLVVLQESLGAQEAKDKERIGTKEAFDGLTIELESSRRKMQDLEQELQFSAGEAQRFEEMSKLSGSHAEAESQKAMEFERLLELARFSAKEMEDQMASLREELKFLYEKIAESEIIEESLNSTVVKLSAARGELEISKLQILDLEQKLASGEAVISELTQELNLHKSSGDKLKEDILALENLFSSAKEDLQAKIMSLDEHELKLQEQVKMRETVEASLKDQELQFSGLKGELVKATGEKEVLEMAIADLNSNLLQMKELCSDLEAKLNLTVDNFSKTDALLSQALSHNAELEEKIKLLEERHQESGTLAATATQRSLELEDIVRASSAAEQEAKSQLIEIETQLMSAEQRNLELEQQLNLVELKNSDADRELKQFSNKISELTATLKAVEEESMQLKAQLKENEDKIIQLESALSTSSEKNSELENELKNVSEKCSHHESKASTTHQRCLELEDLIQTSSSKSEEAGRKRAELELLLEAANYRVQEFEEKISMSEAKCRDVEAEAKQHSEKVSELTAELETFQGRLLSLETALQSANEKEKVLTESLNAVTEERKRFEDASNSSNQMLSEAENMLEDLRNELKLAHDKLKAIEQDLNASGIRESEIVEKLKSAEEQLEQQGKLIELATARTLELELLNESLSKDSELKLQEATDIFARRDSEAKDLCEKLRSHEKQLAIHQANAAEAAEREASLKAELEEGSIKLATLENNLNELKGKVIEAETKATQSFSDNELLAETNSQLKQELELHQIKLNELQELLSSLHAEREAASIQLVSHERTITELTDQHSRGLELQSLTESHIKETELQLEEAIARLTLRDSEAKGLDEKRVALETQIKFFEEQANEAAAAAESQKAELEETLSKLKHLEGVAAEAAEREASLKAALEESSTKLVALENNLDELKGKVLEAESKATQSFSENDLLVETNLQLKQELESHQTKLNELQELLSSLHAEKEAAATQLASHERTITKLTDQHSRGLELQSLTESHIKETELQLEEAIARLTLRDSEAKDLDEKRVALETQIKFLEEQANEAAAAAESQKAELEETLSKLKHLEGVAAEAAEREASLKAALEESSTKLVALENILDELKGKVLEAESKATQSFSENELLVETNLQLKQELESHQTKLNELQELLSSLHAEKEAAATQLASHERTITKLTDQHSRGLELQSLTESHIKETELQLEEAIARLTLRDSEAKDLDEKRVALETQIKFLEEQANEAAAAAESQKAELEETLSKLKHLEGVAAEAAEREASLKAALEESSTKLVALENNLDELKGKVLEAESKTTQSFSENELLVETNLQLKQELESHQTRLNELQELLSSLHAEKEAAAIRLASHERTITELTDQHSRGLELQSLTESHIKESELQLQEAIAKVTLRDSEVKDLDEKRVALETQIKFFEEQVNEATAAAESQKVELEETSLKLKHLEGVFEELQSKAAQFETENKGLVEANLKLTQELAAYETKMNELQGALNGILVEREETYEQLHSSRKTIEDLTEQLAAEGQRLQSQISSVVEENNLITKTYQDAKDELQAVIFQLGRQLDEQKDGEVGLNSDVQNLKAELTEKSIMQARIAELEEQLMLTEAHLKVENVKAIAVEKEPELTSRWEHERQLQERDSLGEQVVQLEKELSRAHAIITEEKEANSRKELEREAASKHSHEELEQKHQHAILLAQQVEDLEKKLQLAETKYREKEVEGQKLALVNSELEDLKNKISQTAGLEKKTVELEKQLKSANAKLEEQVKERTYAVSKDEIEAKSRDFGSTILSHRKGKSKKRVEEQAVEASSVPSQITEASSAMSIKFIFGVAMVAVVIGVIIGKQY